MKTNMEKYLDGEELYGDDFTPDEIKQWFEDEKEAYAELGEVWANGDDDEYGYHAANIFHGFKLLPKDYYYNNACAFGGSYGYELLPIRSKIDKATIVDSSKKFGDNILKELKANFIQARVDGIIEAPDSAFDLITCFGVLHHIPNVSFVFAELVRCLKRGGFLIIREPNSSMGDWRVPRRGVTKHERGIPPKIIERLILQNNLEIISQSSCFFSPLRAFFDSVKKPIGSMYTIVAIDSILSRLTEFNYRYHKSKFLDKFSPGANYYVLRKK